VIDLLKVSGRWRTWDVTALDLPRALALVFASLLRR
jgi:hypothetical protein